MDSLRKWFYRPKKDDKSLLAQFFFADETLTVIAGELDSFDGRKDPERCTALVTHLRQAQDKVLTIVGSIMDTLIGDERANRDFRAKFPEDVLQENLAGQLWFGAECLAAGSSIMNREAESTQMRPLARALTKSLENVRNLLREACLRNNTTNGPLKLNNNELFTEMLLESLKIFDRLFADFELCYVSAMVPVKTMQEYELQELIGVLFSETLQRALKMRLLTQEMVDVCDPALMFTIPRLAIVSGLLVFPNGPLCIDKPVEELSEMFRPFRTLLLKIRELLWTLNKRELYTLEKLLCDNEQSADFRVAADNQPDEQYITQFYTDYSLCKDLTSQFYSITTDNVGHDNDVETVVEALLQSNVVQIPSTSGFFVSNTVDHDSIVASIPNQQESVLRAESLPDHDSLQVISDAAASLSSFLNTKESHRDDVNKVGSPHDSGICTENTSLDRSPSLEINRCDCTAGPRLCECSPSTSKDATGEGRQGKQLECSKHHEEDASSVWSTDTSSFSSADDEEIAMAMQAAEFANRDKVRSKFRSSEDLIHRLYVCIAGVADQLQTNFASDLRNILRGVFLINTSDPETPSIDGSLQSSIEYHPDESEIIENEFSVDPNILAQEALFDSNVYFHLNGENAEALEYSNHPRPEGNAEDSLSADVSRYVTLVGEEEPTTAEIVELPPVWIPDIEAPKCMSCGSNFTVVKRRHHCRNCGKVFCARCSSNSVPLPKFGHMKPVRVCNKCFMYHLAPFTM